MIIDEPIRKTSQDKERFIWIRNRPLCRIVVPSQHMNAYEYFQSPDKLAVGWLYRDEHLLILNKPSGLAVQGGTGTARHLDGMLDALQFDAAERPKLVRKAPLRPFLLP